MRHEKPLLSGLPEEFFDQALHWQPAAGGNVRLRYAAAQMAKSTAPEFPTWSWAAWETVEDTSQMRNAEYDGGVRYEALFQVQTDNRGAL